MISAVHKTQKLTWEGLYLNDVDVGLTVASCEDSVNVRRDSQSFCDTVRATDYAANWVNCPEQLTWKHEIVCVMINVLYIEQLQLLSMDTAF